VAAQFFAGSRPKGLPSPTGHRAGPEAQGLGYPKSDYSKHRAEPEAQGLGYPKSDYSKHRSAESHYAYDCSGAIAASPPGARLSGGLP
jgi:hypothetical protein